MREHVKDVINQRDYVLAVQRQDNIDVFATMSDPNICILYCIMVNQYTHIVGNPFLIFIQKNQTKEEVREQIVIKLMEMRV